MTATVTIDAASKKVEFTKVVLGQNAQGEQDSTTETCTVEAGESTTLHIHDGFQIGYIKEVDEQADNGEFESQSNED
jgi:hypothetical protein